MKDETRGEKIWTKDFGGGITWRLTGNVNDDNNSWGTASSIPTSGHWAVEQSWDYYLQTFGREGPNGNGDELRVYTSWPQANARWRHIGGKDGIWLGFNMATGLSRACLDVVGHEYTHGVINSTAKLVFERESGALSESFSDIFGAMVQRFALGDVPAIWTHGEDHGAGTPTRSFTAPLTTTPAQPDTRLGTAWVAADPVSCPSPSGFNDNCGVHINSGVQNRWFNLLAVGGTLNGVIVTGIGIDKAALIAHDNLTSFMQKHSDYQDAREGAINAAIGSFGPCSNEVIQTANAWAAVGVGGTMAPCTSITITGDFIVCINAPQFPYIFTATASPGGGNFTWSGIPSSWNTTVSGASNSVLTVNSISPMPNSPTNVTLNADYSTGVSGHIVVKFQTMSCVPFTDPCDGEDGLIAGSNKAGRISAKPDDKKQAAEMLDEGNAGKLINLFPNPASQVLHLEVSPTLEENITFELKDLSGKLVLKGVLKTHKETIFIGDLPSGFYVLHSTSNQVNETHSILIIN